MNSQTGRDIPLRSTWVQLTSYPNLNLPVEDTSNVLINYSSQQ